MNRGEFYKFSHPVLLLHNKMYTLKYEKHGENAGYYVKGVLDLIFNPTLNRARQNMFQMEMLGYT